MIFFFFFGFRYWGTDVFPVDFEAIASQHLAELIKHVVLNHVGHVRFVQVLVGYECDGKRE